MKKSKKRRWVKRKINKKILALVAGVALLISAQAFIDYLLWHNLNDNDPSVIRELVLQANDNLYKPAPVDARTGDIYIPEARLRIPAQQTFTELHYFYQPADAAAKQEAEIYASGGVWTKSRVRLFTGTTGAPLTLKSFFDQVPVLQSCSRQYRLSFSKQSSSGYGDYKLLESLTLTDGRTVYLARNLDCPLEDNDFAALFFKNLHTY